MSEETEQNASASRTTWKTFEAHITYELDDVDVIRTFGEVRGWRFSKLVGEDGDSETRCYLTSHGMDARTLLREAYAIVDRIGITAVRIKIEEIVFDSRVSSRMDLG